ncbi:ATPase, T2SS/T4P/T4SS family [Cupriavidus taiwanensis]|uniref:Putative Type II secretion system protein E n=1 Tax=Cupriavidus taiwanensis TaxID=164546 RepID=A0A7Z7NR09_9BURK|nr:ATPase, T2SS/T4P/T4SS family [Cupriavidus taiwanensis]SOZ17226.1 putative Type II secretion system protein E [Cupriavidus taiwanensis]SOZ96446.1 putative Type II secretion system protein E [Cupriavidus taiwanensis]SPC25609.1 putative Type II secretion system protein E [Cupriavidus taiwanensis]
MNAIANLLGFGPKKPVVVAPVAKRKVAAKQAAQPAAEQHKWVRNFAEIPTYRCIHTGKKSDLAKGVTDDFRRGCIALGNEKSANFYVDPRFHKDRKSLVRSTAAQLKAAGIRIDGYYYAPEELIAQLYATEPTLDTSNGVLTEGLTSAEIFWNEMIDQGLELGATDLHVLLEEANRTGSLLYRVNGDLIPPRSADKGVHPIDTVKDAVAFAYNKLHADKTNNDAGFSTEIDLECMVPYDNGKEAFNIRYTGTPNFGGFTVYLRYLFSKTTDWSSPQGAGYSDDQAAMLFSAMRARKGAVSFSGITGSGKSTTAKYFLEQVDQLNGHRLNIITVEHPVEYKIHGARQKTIQETTPDAWRDVQRRLVREDPDAVFIGEVRCVESGQTAKIMNETGHLTLFTVHADSVLGVFNRLVDPTIGFTLGTLTMPNFWNLIVYQALVPTLCKDCKQPVDEQLPDLARFLQDRFSIDTTQMRVRNEDGCDKCNHTGVAGVEVVAEMLQPTRAILEKIREGKIFDAERIWRSSWDQRFDSPNMTGKTVFQHALYKAYLGRIDPRTVETFETFDRFEII